jgi:hypothetical protein
MKNKSDDPEMFLQRSLDEARASRDSTAAKLKKAEPIVAEKRAKAKRLEHDDAEERVVRAALADARVEQDHIDNLSVVLVEKEQRVVQLEQELAAAIDARTRAATAAEVTKLGEELALASEDLAQSAGRLADVAGKIATFSSYDGGSLAAYATSLKNDVPPTILMIQTSLKTYATMVLHGSAAATLPQPPQPAPAPPPPAPTTTVFAIRHVAWRAEDGTICTAGKFFDVSLPPAIARRALKAGVAVEQTDPVRRKAMGTVGIVQPSLAVCEWIGDGEKPVSDSRPFSDPRSTPPVHRSPPVPEMAMRNNPNVVDFQETIGRPYKLPIPRGEDEP